MAKAARRKPMSEINVVPYIDVMLVLLVIFMVTAPMMTQGINVDLPEAASGPIDVDENEPMLIVSVKADGTYYMNVGEEEEAVTLTSASAIPAPKRSAMPWPATAPNAACARSPALA